MANVFEGAPDARQSADVAAPVSRFRPTYRALTDEEKAAHDAIKATFVAVEIQMGRVKPGRYHSLAMTALEESCMRIIKELTS
ncbi:MAG: DUF7681 family protein [Pseudonocardiaceae bacterium]